MGDSSTAQDPVALTVAPQQPLRDEESPSIPKWIAAITAGLTVVCIVFAMILCLRVISGGINGDKSELMIRLLMSCIAVFVGLAFASLGFGLFLLRARGAFRARVEGDAVPRGFIESTAPGLVVIVCATVVMWLALRIRFEVTTTTGSGTSSAKYNYIAPELTSSTSSNPPALLHEKDGIDPP